MKIHRLVTPCYSPLKLRGEKEGLREIFGRIYVINHHALLRKKGGFCYSSEAGFNLV